MTESDILEAQTNAQRARAAPASCRADHGRQRPLGGARGLPRFEGHRRGVEALRRAVRAAIELEHRLSDGLFLLGGKLVAPARGGGKPPRRCCIASSATISRSCTPAMCACASSARAPISRPTSRTLLREAEQVTQAQHRADPGRRLQLRRRGRRSRRRRARLRKWWRKADSTPEEIDADAIRAAARHGRHSRSGPDHPHLGRAAAVEFPAVAGGLRRIRLPADSSGRISTKRRCRRRSPNTPIAIAGSAGLRAAARSAKTAS